MLIMLLMRYILEMWELRDILNYRWALVKLYPQKKVAVIRRLQVRPHLGLRNRFPEDGAWRMFICHSRYLQAPTFLKYISYVSLSFQYLKLSRHMYKNLVYPSYVKYIILKYSTRRNFIGEVVAIAFHKCI